MTELVLVGLSLSADSRNLAKTRRLTILHSLADSGTEAAFNGVSHRVNGGWNGRQGCLENQTEARAAIVA